MNMNNWRLRVTRHPRPPLRPPFPLNTNKGEGGHRGPVVTDEAVI